MGVPMKRRNRGEAGVTLMELLIVVAILGLIAMILTIAVAKTIRRQRLEAAAQEIRNDLQAVYTRVMTTQQPVFVRIDNTNRKIDIMGSQTGTPIYMSFRISSDLSLSTASVTGLQCNWPVVSGYPMLQCDFMGRTLVWDATASEWIQPDATLCPALNTGDTAGIPALVITHKDMVTGNLRPKVRYTIFVNPLWNTKATMAKY